MDGYVNAVMVDLVCCINDIYFNLSSFHCFLKAFRPGYFTEQGKSAMIEYEKVDASNNKRP